MCIFVPTCLNCFCIQYLQARSELEQQSIDTANTSEAVGLITQVQALKRKMINWEKNVDVCILSNYTSKYMYIVL